MKTIFALFAVLLIATGAILLAIPREEPQRATSRGVAPQVISYAVRARDLAEQVNAPLSILFGIVSLYYSRKRYLTERDDNANGKK